MGLCQQATSEELVASWQCVEGQVDEAWAVLRNDTCAACLGSKYTCWESVPINAFRTEMHGRNEPFCAPKR